MVNKKSCKSPGDLQLLFFRSRAKEIKIILYLFGIICYTSSKNNNAEE